MLSKDEKKRQLILFDKNIYKGLIIMTLPLMLNNFIKTIHDIIDMFFVGRIPGYGIEAINAIQLTFPVFFTFISLGIGLSAAGTAIISQLVGANKLDKAKQYAGNLLIIAVILGALLNVFAFFVGPLIMELMGARGYVLAESSSYIRIRSFELIFVFLFFAFTSIRQASGDTLTAVIYGVITVVINIVLSPTLIQVFHMGVAGAAYATLAANVLIVPFFARQLFVNKTGITISFDDIKMRANQMKELIKTAIPASLGQAVTAIGFILINTIIYTFGDQVLAAFTVGNRLNSMILHPVMAIGGVVSAYIGQNIGNHNPDRAKETFKKAMYLSIGISVFFALLFMFMRRPLVSIFLHEDPAAVELASTYMIYVLSSIPLMAIFQTFLGTYNGAGRTGFTFMLSITRLWVLRIPLVLLFTYVTQIGASGIWIAMTISNLVIILPGVLLYKKITFKPIVQILRKREPLEKVV